jgi:hypothetical protein
MEDYDAISTGEFGYSRAEGRYYARGFMAENAGRGMGAGGDLFQVGAANAAGMHSDQQFSGGNLRNGNSFHTDVVDAAVNGCEHGCGNRLAALLDFELSGNPHQ